MTAGEITLSSNPPTAYLFLQRHKGNKGIPFLGVACYCNADNVKFDAQGGPDRGRDNGVVAQDLFGFIGI